MLNDYIEAVEQLIDAIQAKIAEHGDGAPASANLRKDVGVIEPCTLRELLFHVQAALSRINAINNRVDDMLASSSRHSPPAMTEKLR